MRIRKQHTYSVLPSHSEGWKLCTLFPLVFLKFYGHFYTLVQSTMIHKMHVRSENTINLSACKMKQVALWQLTAYNFRRRENRRFDPAVDSVLNLGGRDCGDEAGGERTVSRLKRRSRVWSMSVCKHAHISSVFMYPQRLKTEAALWIRTRAN